MGGSATDDTALLVFVIGPTQTKMIFESAHLISRYVWTRAWTGDFNL